MIYKGIKMEGESKVTVPLPQTKEVKEIVRRRLQGKEYRVVEVESKKIVFTKEEEEYLEEKYTPYYVFFAVLTKTQLGNQTRLSGEELDDKWNSCRRSNDNTLCLYRIVETEQWYRDLSRAQKDVVYPQYNPDEEEYPNLETIYDYLDANRSEWEEEVTP